MERLTARNENGAAYYPHCFKEDTCCGDGVSEKCNDCKFEKEIIERLAAYEDTNLTPEQIVEIDKLYRKKCEELERLKKYLPAFRIGDTAYLVDFDAGTFDKSVVNGIVSRVDGDTAKFDYDSDLLDFCDTDIGVCVFRSEPEAQEALERMVQNG